MGVGGTCHIAFYFPSRAGGAKQSASQTAVPSSPKDEPLATEHHEELIKLSAEQLAHAGIELDTAKSGRIASSMDLPGKIVLNADSTAHVLAQFDGTVREVRVSLGASIKVGDVLAVLDSSELADLNAAYRSSSTRLELAQLTLKREQALWEQKISAEQDFLTAKHAYAEAQIEQRQARQKLKAYGIDEATLTGATRRPDANLARFEIKAPAGGSVIAKDVTLGEAAAATDKLFEIADLSTVWLDISVFIKDLSSVTLGQVVDVTASGIHESTTGTITYIQPLANITNRAVLARVVHKMLPAARKRVNLDGETRFGCAPKSRQRRRCARS